MHLPPRRPDERLVRAPARARRIADELAARGPGTAVPASAASSGAGGSMAAVAMLLRLCEERTEVLLMQRTVHVGDRWSGQVALPGGHHAPGDRDLVATAVRETREEVGVDLARSASLLGSLASVRARARGELLPLRIAPFVFACRGPVRAATSREAEAVFWLPLEDVAAGVLDGTYRYVRDGGSAVTELPCWRFEGRTVWGLTYQMLRDLLAVVLPDG